MSRMLRRAAGTRVAATTAIEDSGDSVIPALCSRGLLKGTAYSEVCSVCVKWLFDPIRGVCSTRIRHISGKGNKWE